MDIQDDEEKLLVRRVECGNCFCDFFMPVDINPVFCPMCGDEFGEIRDMPVED